MDDSKDPVRGCTIKLKNANITPNNLQLEIYCNRRRNGYFVENIDNR